MWRITEHIFSSLITYTHEFQYGRVPQKQDEEK